MEGACGGIARIGTPEALDNRPAPANLVPMAKPDPNQQSARGGMSSVALVASVLVGAVFIFSAFTKLLSPKAFVSSIGEYELLPASLSLFAATGVVGLEVCLGVLLILGIYRRFAAFVGAGLMIFFIGILIHAIRLGLDSCGCFGEVISIPPPVELVLDAVLLVLCLVILVRGRDVAAGGAAFRQSLAWGSLCLGAALFLAADPSVHADEELIVATEDLQVLAAAQPPIALPQEGFLFFFSADCPHCWSFAGAVEGMATRLEDFEVHGVTFSDPQTLDQFKQDFSPSYPIHILTESQFYRVTDQYPAGLWISGGEVVEGWSGLVPSHRELSDSGGYFIREQAQLPVEAEPELEPEAPDESPFGGPVKSRH